MLHPDLSIGAEDQERLRKPCDAAVEDALAEIADQLLEGLEIGPDEDELVRRVLSLAAACGRTAYTASVLSAARAGSRVATRPTPPL